MESPFTQLFVCNHLLAFNHYSALSLKSRAISRFEKLSESARIPKVQNGAQFHQ